MKIKILCFFFLVLAFPEVEGVLNLLITYHKNFVIYGHHHFFRSHIDFFYWRSLCFVRCFNGFGSSFPFRLNVIDNAVQNPIDWWSLDSIASRLKGLTFFLFPAFLFFFPFLDFFGRPRRRFFARSRWSFFNDDFFLFFAIFTVIIFIIIRVLIKSFRIWIY